MSFLIFCSWVESNRLEFGCSTKKRHFYLSCLHNILPFLPTRFCVSHGCLTSHMCWGRYCSPILTLFPPKNHSFQSFSVAAAASNAILRDHHLFNAVHLFIFVIVFDFFYLIKRYFPSLFILHQRHLHLLDLIAKNQWNSKVRSFLFSYSAKELLHR